MTVALKLSGFVAFVLGLALAIGHNFWAGLSSGNPEIVKEFASMTPFVAVSLVFHYLKFVLNLIILWFQGLWIGLIRGITCQTSIILLNVLLKNWGPRSNITRSDTR
ncbi:hypothetical protein ACE6H2_014541 [Prunus campanulata]